jgi:Transposase IS116/IS110/IS902 family
MPLSQWRCRRCGFDRYHCVSVLRKNGAPDGRRLSMSVAAAGQGARVRTGIGPITASALVAIVGNRHDFKSGRQFTA